MALLYKQKTGKGLRVDIAMLDCAFYMCESPVLEHSITGEFTPRSGNHHSWYAPYGEFKALDGNVVIAVTKEPEWEALCLAIGRGDLLVDQRFADNALRVSHRDDLIEELEKTTAAMERYELEKRLRGVGVAAAAVQSLAEFDSNPQTRELHVIEKINQPGVGEYTVTNTPVLFSKTPVDPDAPAAGHPGEHTLEILGKLGYSQSEIDSLIGSGAVHQAV